MVVVFYMVKHMSGYWNDQPVGYNAVVDKYIVDQEPVQPTIVVFRGMDEYKSKGYYGGPDSGIYAIRFCCSTSESIHQVFKIDWRGTNIVQQGLAIGEGFADVVLEVSEVICRKTGGDDDILQPY